MEVAHALSMVPGMVYAVLQQKNDFFILSSCFAYVATCVFSMNFHIYKHFTQDFDVYSKEHLLALFLDITSQNITVIFTSMLTHAGYTGSLLGLVSCFIDYYIIYHLKHHYSLLRHVRMALLVSWMVCDNPNALLWFLNAFMLFIIAKYKVYILHVPFHICLSFAMKSIWDKYTQQTDIIPLSYALPIQTTLFIVMSMQATKVYPSISRSLEYLVIFIFHVVYGCLNVYSSITEFDSTKLFIFTPVTNTSLQQFQVMMEIAYYTGFGIYEIQHKQIGMVIHHMLATGLILFSHLRNYHHFITITLCMFSISNPFLSFAKLAKHNGKDVLARVSFACFAVLFCIFRIAGIPWLIKCTLIDSLAHVTISNILCANIPLLALYTMQWWWLGKIIQKLRC